MAFKHPPIQTTCAPETLAVLSRDRTSSGVRAALEEYAGLIEGAGRELESAFTPAEWNYLADSLNGTLTEGYTPADLAIQVRDADALRKAGRKWKVKAEELATTCEALSPLHLAALFAAVRFFFSSDESPEQWWRVAARKGVAK